jgi:hypothetical protein
MYGSYNETWNYIAHSITGNHVTDKTGALSGTRARPLRTASVTYQPGASWKPQTHPFPGRWNGWA